MGVRKEEKELNLAPLGHFLVGEMRSRDRTLSSRRKYCEVETVLRPAQTTVVGLKAKRAVVSTQQSKCGPEKANWCSRDIAHQGHQCCILLNNVLHLT